MEEVVRVLRSFHGHRMHNAYCAGFLRPSLETPLLYALWLGYADFDRGLPD